MPCARGWSPLLPLLLLLLLLSGAAGTYDLVRICNPEGPLSTAFVGEVHARYPWTSHPEWGGACVRLAMFQKIVEDAIANCDIIGSCDATGEQKRDAERAIPPCDTLKALEADAAARLNAWIPFAHAPFLPVVRMLCVVAVGVGDMLMMMGAACRIPRPRIWPRAGAMPTIR
jgi:hypothetical protein